MATPAETVTCGGLGALWAIAMLLLAPRALAQPATTPTDAPADAPAARPSPDAPATPACPPDALCEDVDVEPPESDEPPDAAPPDAEPPVGNEVRRPPRALPEPESMRVGEPLDSEAADWDPSKSAPSPPSSLADDVTTAGLVVFVVGYLPAFTIGIVAAAIEDGDDQDEADAEEYLPMLLPALGPPITGALVHASPVVWGLLIADTAVQVIGLGMLGVGIAMDDDAPSSARARVMPTLIGDGRRSFGLGLAGAF